MEDLDLNIREFDLIVLGWSMDMDLFLIFLSDQG